MVFGDGCTTPILLFLRPGFRCADSIIDCAIVQPFEWLFVIVTAAKMVTEVLQLISQGKCLSSISTCR
jgi:hypothetical protein